MLGYSATNVFTVKAQAIARRVSLMVESVDEHKLKNIKCHELARAVGEIFKLKVIDGKYLGTVEHSWCIIGNYILDCYSVGRIPMVQLIDNNLHSDLYLEKKLDIKIDGDMVKILVKIMRRIPQDGLGS